MNEKIQELATQAANYANIYDDAGADIWFKMYNKKFAELIVEECINICISNGNDDSAQYIEKHFGVEE